MPDPRTGRTSRHSEADQRDQDPDHGADEDHDEAGEQE